MVEEREPSEVHDLTDEQAEALAEITWMLGSWESAAKIPGDTGDTFANDRRPISKDDLAATLNYIGQTFQPIDRANYYATLGEIMNTGGTGALFDIELAILAWAPNDHLATEAVEYAAHYPEDNRFAFNPATYDLYVSFGGSANAARQYILEKNNWAQPGGWKGVADDAWGAAGAVAQFYKPGVIPGMGAPNNEGSSLFRPDSRLQGLLIPTQQVRRSNVSGMRTGWDDKRILAENTVSVVETMGVIFAGALTTKAAITAVPKVVKFVGSKPWAASIAASPSFQRVKRFFNAINPGADVERRRFSPVRLASIIQYRTGQTAESVFNAAARRGLPEAPKWAPSVAGNMALIGGSVMFGEIGLGAYGYFAADEYDITYLEKQIEQLERSDGETTDAEAEEIRILQVQIGDIRAGVLTPNQEQQARLEAAQLAHGPYLHEFDADYGIDDLLSGKKPFDKSQMQQASFSVMSDSPFAAEIKKLMDLSDSLTTIGKDRVDRANDFEANAIRAQTDWGDDVPEEDQPVDPDEAPPSTTTTVPESSTTTTTPNTGALSGPSDDQYLFEFQVGAAVASILDGGDPYEDDPDLWGEYQTGLERKMSQIMDELGLTYFDPDGLTIEEMNEADNFTDLYGWTLYDDPSAPKTDPRHILLPPEIKAAAFVEYMNDWVDFEEEEDLLIRVPEGYSARTFEREIKAPGGGTITGTDSRFGGMDDFEARFIEKAQGFSGTDVEGAGVEATYRESDTLDFINAMSFTKVMEFQELAGRAGFYGTSGQPLTRGYMTAEDQQHVVTVLGQANVDGQEFWQMLRNMAQNPGRYGRGPLDPYSPPKAPAMPARLPYSVPLSLRSIPGPKTIAEQAQATFEEKMGRQARPDELASIGSQLSGSYTQRNQQLIALDMARYDGDNGGLITGAQFKAIEDPQSAAMFDISSKWKDEINLNERREANSTTFQRMLNATMGNRASIGNMTAAENVQQTGRV